MWLGSCRHRGVNAWVVHVQRVAKEGQIGYNSVDACNRFGAGLDPAVAGEHRPERAVEPTLSAG
jgi:xanthine dehydrogenase iron-sulfur cluster and FAD-binding subunit A